MDVLHLVTSNNTMMKTSNMQIAIYNMSTIRSILSMHYTLFNGFGVVIRTPRHLYATFDVFMLIFPHFDGYQAVGQVINDCLTQV